jgi:hypothetical protein
MLIRLQQLLCGPLQDMLADPAHPWKTVDVTYEDPHVERVWTQWDEDRVSLHRIHPCASPLFHPHPWPSAMKVFSGQYAMGVGRSKSGGTPGETVRLVLAPGSQYEMLDDHGWHWVQPVDLPVMSVMLTGKPWKMPEGFPRHGQGHVHAELSDAVRDDILVWFRRELGVLPT